MSKIEVSLATEDDRKQLLEHFKHYQNQEHIEKRVNCYLSHNFTVVAKDKDRIVGVVQWYVKENPTEGIVEFEEVHVLESYRGKGIGSMLIEFAVQSVREHFDKIGLKLKKIFLFTDKENEAAKALFEKCGFGLETGYFYSLELK
jgi:ribosomal protein S18 acetylase RimI-like enzyme